MGPERDERLDAARGCAMVLVLYGHGLEPLFLNGSAITQGPAFAVWQMIYAFHMPFFFLLCGVTDGLKRERGGVETAVRSAVKLTATALVFSTLAVIPQITWGDRLVEDTLLDNLRGAGFGLAPLWFLVVLALVRIIHAVAIASSKLLSALVMAGALAISWLCATHAIKLWHVYSLIGALPFYTAGRLLGTRAFHVPPLAAGCGLAALLVFAPANLAVVATGQYGDLPSFALASVGGCAVMLAVADRLSGWMTPAAASVGRRSFELFIASGIALALAPRMDGFDGWAGAVAAGILAVPLQIGAGRFLRRPIAAVRMASEHLVDALSPGGAAQIHT